MGLTLLPQHVILVYLGNMSEWSCLTTNIQIMWFQTIPNQYIWFADTQTDNAVDHTNRPPEDQIFFVDDRNDTYRNLFIALNEKIPNITLLSWVIRIRCIDPYILELPRFSVNCPMYAFTIDCNRVYVLVPCIFSLSHLSFRPLIERYYSVSLSTSYIIHRRTYVKHVLIVDPYAGHPRSNTAAITSCCKVEEIICFSAYSLEEQLKSHQIFFVNNFEGRQ